MSKSNYNNPHLVVVPLGSITSDGSLPALYLPKKSEIKSVALIDQAGIAADNSNWISVKLQNGSTEIATFDSRAAGNGALTALEGKAMTLVAAQAVQAAGSSLKVVYDETGTVGMTSAIMVIELYEV